MVLRITSVSTSHVSSPLTREDRNAEKTRPTKSPRVKVSEKADGETPESAASDVKRPRSMFTAMVVGVLVGAIFKAFATKTFFSEDSLVPDFVKNWFDTIVGVLLSLLAAYIITFLLNLDLFTVVGLILSPVTNFAQTLPGVVIIGLVMGIAANTIGTVRGGSPHTYEEWIETKSLESGLALVLALMLGYAQ